MTHIAHGTVHNMVQDTHCMDVMDTKAIQAVVQRYTRIGLIGIKSNNRFKKKKTKTNSKIVHSKSTETYVLFSL